jgi:tetratricopeptide (TPR) repeat protein
LPRRLPPFAVAAALVLPFVFAAGEVLERSGAERPYDVAWVPHGGALRHLSPAIRLSLGNYYWLLAVQYVGEARADERGFDKLFPLIDLVTDLDPGHGYAYQSGGIVLSTRGLLDESDRILKKGIERGPNWWSFPFYIAFYAEAARWAEIAARTPGASPNISHLALAMKVKSGAPEDAVRLLEELLGVAKDDATRAALEEQYKLALAQVNFSRLDQAVAAFKARHGRAPTRLEELVASGVVAGIPEEPFGGRYVLHADGSVHSTARDFRFAPAEAWRAKLAPRPQPPASSRPAPPRGQP